MLKRSLVFSLLPVAVLAQQNISIKGKIPELSGQSVNLENSNHSKHILSIDGEGTFSFNAKVDSGYYWLDKDVYLYLAPSMSLDISGGLSNLTFTGKGSLENSTLKNIEDLVTKYFPVEGGHLHSKFNSLEPDSFINLTNLFKQEVKTVLDRVNQNESFKKSQDANTEYVVKYFINDYLQRYGIEADKEAEYYRIAEKLKPGSDVVETLYPALKAIYGKKLPVDKAAELQAMVWQNFDLNRSDLYSFSSHYRKLVLDRLEAFRTAELVKYPYLKSKNSNEIKRDIVAREFKEGAVKEDLLCQITGSLLNGNLTDEKHVTEYLSLAKDDYNRKLILSRFEKLKRVSPGQESPLFTYKDNHNQTVSLSSLKGSYVYLDIWATWSNASLLEIPYLRSIERKYQSQNIKFITLSVDMLGQKDKWLKTVKEQHPMGMHLIADKDCRSDFIKAYGITTFPRFIIIDPEGRIVTANAPRPSNPKLQETLDKLLITTLSTCSTCGEARK